MPTEIADHYGCIVDTYRKVLQLTDTHKPSIELLEAIIQCYGAGYSAGEDEEAEKVHFFYIDMVDREELYRRCHSNGGAV
ncbi:hypothetical protein AB4Z45_21815 [Paenibacillus sp. MCAF9]|uniref:hypothetical protein n=1 Tax=Paenibacillus sp. MCAF9 TaxID=3233046 RepID=UPI003F9BDD1A